MARAKKVCTEYISCDVTVQVHFPRDMLICDICDFCRAENNGTRFRCLLNSRILPYHNSVIGFDCPLPIRQQIEEEQANLSECEE
jgi:hypothetical protein